MKKYKVCSDKHFKSMLNKFRNISFRVISEIGGNYSELYSNFIYSKMGNLNYDGKTSPFDLLLLDLFKAYKSNPYKTKSGFDDELCGEIYNKFWATYTFEDDYSNRSKVPNNIVFRVYSKIGNNKKKRIVYWQVPITWKYLN